MIYTDEDKVDIEGKLSGPIFKPDWCPNYFLSRMYTCHLSAYRREIVVALGGFEGVRGRPELRSGAAHLRKRTQAIHHIPKILYHWRIIGLDRGRRARSCMSTRRIGGRSRTPLRAAASPPRVERVPGELGFYLIRYALQRQAAVSVADTPAAITATCFTARSSRFSLRTDYPDFEVPGSRQWIDRAARDRSARTMEPAGAAALPRHPPRHSISLLHALQSRRRASGRDPAVP